jgi:hypothetical protein
MRWKVTNETVEEPDGTMHRPDCPRLGQTIREEHRRGALIERNVAPKECWHCEPGVEMVLTL